MQREVERPGLRHPAAGGKHGRNGIVVCKADGVSIENLTACNFLAGSSPSGNEIWWNGGDGTGKIGIPATTALPDCHVDASSTRPPRRSTASSRRTLPGRPSGDHLREQLERLRHVRRGVPPGVQHHDRQRLDGVQRLGYSGTNSGGAVVIKNSEFDHNQDGLDTNTQIAGDPPAPQNGACPGNAISPITHTHSCWVFMHNKVHDNNNPNVPNAGTASEGRPARA